MANKFEGSLVTSEDKFTSASPPQMKGKKETAKNNSGESFKKKSNLEIVNKDMIVNEFDEPIYAVKNIETRFHCSHSSYVTSSELENIEIIAKFLLSAIENIKHEYVSNFNITKNNKNLT